MSILITILRLIHIFSSVIWVGGGLFFLTVIAPTVRDAGADGGKFMQWVARQGRLGRTFAIVSGLTFVSGLILYPLLNYHNNLSNIKAITLTIGAVFGLLGFLHGLLISGKMARQLTALAKDMAGHQGPPPPDKLQAMQALGAKQGEAAVHSVILISLALLFMAAAQTV
jgi:uncharacterized membrane protein